ncbi:MAG: helix-turn-helix domain-containing protein [Deltaproteobacteria bacterium]|nr:helix-turn-helix domain-containing protein [Deltaproteobacteria bacterium]
MRNMTCTAKDQTAYQARRRYIRALLNGEDGAAFQVIDELLRARSSLGDLYLQLLTPALVRIGQLWCDEEIGVGLEKLASHLVLKHMDRLRGMYAHEERRLPNHVLVSCIEGEQHFIGARMVADLFLAKGWSVDFLGPDVPTPALFDTIKMRQPQLVALSVRTATGVGHARLLVEELTTLEAAPKIILGGQAMAQNEWAQDGACAVARDAVEGVDIAGKLLQLERPKAVLKEYLIGLGQQVRELRNRKGWTQEQLSECTQLTRASIVAVEGGKQNVSMDLVIRLANALETSPEDLLSGKRSLPS